eukprot:768657-Hanusia_phi.AAC.6
MSIAVGIDLGTTYSCVGAYINGKVEIIPDPATGARTVASYVSFKDDEIIVGNLAKSQSTLNPSNTIYDAKRFIGRRFSDKVVQENYQKYPFKILDDGKDRVMFQVQYKGETKNYYPEEISAMILGKLKSMAEEFLGKTVENAVITIPAQFLDSAKVSTKNAGKIAGLEVLRLIAEPISACMAYGLERCDDGRERLIFLCDFGGGTCDLAILEIDGGLYEVKQSEGDDFLGGQDLDEAILRYMIDEFKKKHKKDPSNSPKSLSRLKSAAENAKKNLTSSISTTIEIDSLYEGIDFQMNFTRAKFEQICEDTFNRLMRLIEQMMKNNKDINLKDIVLVGGTTRIPKIQQLVSDYFKGKNINKSINPDEAICYGAAVQASILTGNIDEKTQDILLIDVTPMSLGICEGIRNMHILIDKNTPIPTKKSQIFSTYEDNQKIVSIRIYCGERPFIEDNRLLGTFDLEIPNNDKPRGVPQIEVTFEIDVNNILKVIAKDVSTGNSKDIEIKNSESLTKEEIQKMLDEAERYREEDKKNKDIANAKNELENYLYTMKNNLASHPDESIRIRYTDVILEGLQWLEDNQKCSADEYRDKLKDYKEKLVIE